MTFAAVPDSREVKNIHGTLYTTLNGPDGVFLGMPSGVFSFVDSSGDPEPLPDSPKTKLSLVVQADKDYSKIAGFDMNTEGKLPTPRMLKRAFKSTSRRMETGSSRIIFPFPKTFPRVRTMKRVVLP